MKENKIRTKLLIFINLEMKNNVKKNKDFLINSIKIENYLNYYENYVIIENNSSFAKKCFINFCFK